MKKTSTKKLVILSIIIIFIAWAVYSYLKPRERTFYLASVDMYVKGIKWATKDYAYIMFGKDSILNLSADVDYLKVPVHHEVGFLIDPADKSTLYLNKDFKIYEKNEVHYKMIQTVEYSDTTYYKKVTKPNGAIVTIAQYPYYDFFMGGYVIGFFEKRPDTDHFIRIPYTAR